MAAGLQSEIWNNNIRSIGLLIIYPVIILAIVWGCAYVIGANHPGYNSYYTVNGVTYYSNGGDQAASFAYHALLNFWPTILTVIVIWFMISYWFNASMVRSASGARSVTREEEPELYNILENLCISQGLKTPAINIIETEARNAFASGVRSGRYSVTLTRGLIDTLDAEHADAILADQGRLQRVVVQAQGEARMQPDDILNLNAVIRILGTDSLVVVMHGNGENFFGALLADNILI